MYYDHVPLLIYLQKQQVDAGIQTDNPDPDTTLAEVELSALNADIPGKKRKRSESI